MEYRLARYSSLESEAVIDCDINHPVFGWIPTTVPLDDSDPETKALRDQILSEMTSADLNKRLEGGVLVDVTQAEKDEAIAEATASEAARAARIAAQEAKLVGVEFDGVMCSATKEDMWGLSSVQAWVRAGQSTDFNFDNGNTLTLTAANIDAFEAVWVPFRASFF